MMLEAWDSIMGRRLLSSVSTRLAIESPIETVETKLLEIESIESTRERVIPPWSTLSGWSRLLAESNQPGGGELEVILPWSVLQQEGDRTSERERVVSRRSDLRLRRIRTNELRRIERRMSRRASDRLMKVAISSEMGSTRECDVSP